MSAPAKNAFSPSKEKSYDLASDRAQYTQKFLLNHGINADRISVKSAGDTHPLGAETTQYGQQINRRVDLFISYDGSIPRLYVLPPNLSKNKKRKKKYFKKKLPSKETEKEQKVIIVNDTISEDKIDTVNFNPNIGEPDLIEENKDTL